MKYNINNVLKILGGAFKQVSTPVEPLPPPLIMAGAKLRPGLSSEVISARVISRLSEAGMVVGNVFADGDNTTEKMLTIIIEEVVNAMLTEAKIEIVIPPGVQITAIGAGNLGVPVISQGATTNMAIGDGVIR